MPELAESPPAPSATSEPMSVSLGSPDPQFNFREHPTGVLPAITAQPGPWGSGPPGQPMYTYPAPAQFRPGQPAPGGYPPQANAGQFYPGYPGYPGYPQPPMQPGYSPYPPGYAAYPPYSGYMQPGYPGAYPYPWPPQPYKRPRDGYLFAISITSLVCSILTVLGGLGSLLIFVLVLIVPTTTASSGALFASSLLFGAFTLAGLGGGGLVLYHSIRSLIQKPTLAFKLPRFWTFLILYLAVIAIGVALQINGQAVAIPFMTAILILLAAFFPSLTLLALGMRILRFPKWPTTWRRFITALVSGGTLGISLALILELVFTFLLMQGQTQGLRLIDPTTQNPNAGWLMIILAAVIAPLVEETVKPLAVVIFIGRVQSAAEAFILGMSAGLGFNIIETTSYISLGYDQWLHVALLRSGSGLLHGFGAGMVTLGWYYLTHAKRNRWLLAAGCWCYAVFQHALWNFSASVPLIPGPIGETFKSISLNLGFITIGFDEIAVVILTLILLAGFVLFVRRLRYQETPVPNKPPQPTNQPPHVPQFVATPAQG